MAFPQNNSLKKGAVVSLITIAISPVSFTSNDLQTSLYHLCHLRHSNETICQTLLELVNFDKS